MFFKGHFGRRVHVDELEGKSGGCGRNSRAVKKGLDQWSNNGKKRKKLRRKRQITKCKGEQGL